MYLHRTQRPTCNIRALYSLLTFRMQPHACARTDNWTYHDRIFSLINRHSYQSLRNVCAQKKLCGVFINICPAMSLRNKKLESNERELDLLHH